MNRREFMRTAGGATAVASTASAAAVGPSVAQEGGDGNESGTGGDGNQTGGNQTGGNQSDTGGGGTTEVVVGPDGNLVFEPADIQIEPGTTVLWTWDSPGHNVVPESQPSESNWEGHEPLEGPGFTHEHTFEVEGTYEYVCTPHQGQGMVGSIQVGSGGGEGGGEPADPEEMGVPIHPHFVGIATILAVMVSLMFTFFVLKYGESPHASGGNR